MLFQGARTILKIKFKFDINEKVLDEITGNIVKIIGMRYTAGIKDKDVFILESEKKGVKVYYTDSDYLDGIRHEWELKELKKVDNS